MSENREVRLPEVIVFAGPNGSGKTFAFDGIISLGIITI